MRRELFIRLCGCRYISQYSSRVVLKDAVTDILSPKGAKVYADFTFGAGGHTKALLNLSRNVKILAIDRDPESHALACQLADRYPSGQVVPILGKFSELPNLFLQNKVEINSLDGIILETGPSELQLENSSRGFNLALDGPLDLRMDSDRFPNEPTGADVLNSLDSIPLSHIFKKYGEEKQAKKIAKAIVDARYMNKHILNTSQLASVVNKIIGSELIFDVEQRSLPACTKVFTSLRMFVNNELNELNYAVHVAYQYMKPGGTFITITYSPLEDRIVKKHFMELNLTDLEGRVHQKYINAAKWHTQEELQEITPQKWSVLHRKVLPKLDEVHENPRSAFAKLRAVAKTDPNKKDKDIIETQLIFN